MKLVWQIAFRNLWGAGLRTFLNITVMAMVFLIMLFYNSLLNGWEEKALEDSIAWDFAHGHLTHIGYDSYDPFSIQSGNGTLPPEVPDSQRKALSPVLVWPASIYPQQNQVPVTMKGMSREQKILLIPTPSLVRENPEEIPVVMGKGMAKTAGLEIGDRVMVQWRDRNRTFDAGLLRVVAIFETDVPTVDQGIIYLAIEDLWRMTQLQDHVTYWVADEGFTFREDLSGWVFQTQEELLEPFYRLIAAKKAGALISNGMLLLLALLAIFDTQVMTVFRRQKEIGTYIALGLTRLQVMILFTLEGGMYSLLGMAVGGILGIPLFYYLTRVGIPMTQVNREEIGIPLGERIIPSFHLDSILVIAVLVFITTLMVGYIPARKIAGMNPVDALKGRAI